MQQMRPQGGSGQSTLASGGPPPGHREHRQDPSCTTWPHTASCRSVFSSTDIHHEARSEAAKKSYLIVNTISHHNPLSTSRGKVCRSMQSLWV